MNAEKELILVEAKISRERTTRVFFQRKVVHDLMASLPDPLQDAMIEIGCAKHLYENPGFFRTMNYGRVAGKRAVDLNDWQIDLKKRYEEWRGLLYRYSPLAMAICERICQDEHSIDRISKDENAGHRTVLRLLQYGLNEYSILAGWGDHNGKKSG